MTQLGAGGRTVVAAETIRPISRYRGDQAGGGVQSPEVGRASCGEVAGGAEGAAAGTQHPAGAGRSAVSAETSRPTRRQSGEHAGRGRAEAVVTRVGDVQVAGGVQGDAGGTPQLGAGGRTVVAAEAIRPISRYQAQDAREGVQSQ